MATDTTIALVTLADVRAMVGKEPSDTADDPILEMLIDGVSARFNSHVGRRLLEQTETTAYLDGNGKQSLRLPRDPNGTIAGLEEGGVPLTEGEDQDYRIYSDSGLLVRLGGVWPQGRKNITLSSYRAGYALASVPKDLKYSALIQVAADFQEYRTKSWGETSRSFSDGSITRREAGPFLEPVQAILNLYRDIRV